MAIGNSGILPLYRSDGYFSVKAKMSKKIPAEFRRIAQEKKANCVILLGNNILNSGIQTLSDWKQWEGRFIDENVKIPTFALFGNHDHLGNVAAQINYHFSNIDNSRFWILPDIAYAIKLKNVGSDDHIKIIFTDTEKSADVQTWVDKEMNDDKVKFILVAEDRPIYTAGSSQGDPDMMAALRKTLKKKSNVTGYLHAHNHCMQHFKRGRQYHFGIGGGGSSLETCGDSNAPEHALKSEGKVKVNQEYAQMSKSSHGFALLELGVKEASMKVSYYYVKPEQKEVGDPDVIANIVKKGAIFCDREAPMHPVPLALANFCHTVCKFFTSK